MTSKRFFVLSSIYLFVSAALILFGVLSLIMSLSTKWRYLLADHLIESSRFYCVGSIVVISLGVGLTACVAWMGRGRFVQMKLGRGHVHYESAVMQKLVSTFWQKHYGPCPEVVIDHKERIEIYGSPKGDVFALCKHLEDSLGFCPEIIITSSAP